VAEGVVGRQEEPALAALLHHRRPVPLARATVS
jgi:hypothetical protein